MFPFPGRDEKKGNKETVYDSPLHLNEEEEASNEKHSVVFSEKGRSDFLELRRSSACILGSWMTAYLEGCKNPRVRGKSLTCEVSRWRYKAGKYRILAEIEDNSVVILAIQYD